MQAIIPAAGLGTRMLPFSALAAKELAPIGTRPAFQWVLEEAAAIGVRTAAVVISPHKEALRHFLDGEVSPEYEGHEETRRWLRLLESLRIRVIEQPKPVGLGDALLRGWAALDGKVAYTMYPDNIVTDGVALYKALFQAHSGSGLSCVACKADKPYFPGNNFLVAGEPCGAAYYVTAATAKSGPRPQGKFWRAAGRALLTAEFFAELERARNRKASGELDDIDAYAPLAQAGRLLCLPPLTPIFDAGSPEGYAEAWEALLSRILKR
jgi:UTP--glucose-1-phosphate uridylyltransferase